MPFETNIAITFGFAAITFAFIASSLENRPARVLFYSLSSGLALVLVGSNYAVTERLGDNTTAITSLIHAAFFPTLAIVMLFLVYLFLSIIYNALRPEPGPEDEDAIR